METLINAPTWTTGKYGNALSFDGANNYVNVIDNETLDITDEISISAWVKLETLDNTAGSRQRQPIVSKFWSSGGKRAYEFMFDDTVYCSNKFNASISSTASTWNGGVLGSDITPEIDTWTHILLRFKANEFMEIWINGINHTGSFDLGSLPSSIAINNLDLRIGHDYNTGGYFNGLIDEVAIWNRALDTDEISSIYNVSVQGFEGILEGVTKTFGDLEYSTDQVNQLTDLYTTHGSGQIGDVNWTYLSGNLPGDTDGLVYDIGDTWSYNGKYYIKLGSGLEGAPLGSSGSVPELPVGAISFLGTILSFALTKTKGANLYFPL